MMVVTTEVSPTKIADLSRQGLPSDSMTVNHNLTHAALRRNCQVVHASFAREDGSMRENPCATFDVITARTRRFLLCMNTHTVHTELEL